MTGTLSSRDHEPNQTDSDKEQATVASTAQDAQEGENNSEESASVTDQAWQWATWAGVKTFDGLDFAGEVVADFLGLTRSKYQWILDMQEREAEDKRVRHLEARQRRQLKLEQLLEQEKRRLEELERGVETGNNQAESGA